MSREGGGGVRLSRQCPEVAREFKLVAVKSSPKCCVVAFPGLERKSCDHSSSMHAISHRQSIFTSSHPPHVCSRKGRHMCVRGNNNVSLNLPGGGQHVSGVQEGKGAGPHGLSKGGRPLGHLAGVRATLQFLPGREKRRGRVTACVCIYAVTNHVMAWIQASAEADTHFNVSTERAAHECMHLLQKPKEWTKKKHATWRPSKASCTCGDVSCAKQKKNRRRAEMHMDQASE